MKTHIIIIVFAVQAFSCGSSYFNAKQVVHYNDKKWVMEQHPLNLLKTLGDSVLSQEISIEYRHMSSYKTWWSIRNDSLFLTDISKANRKRKRALNALIGSNEEIDELFLSQFSGPLNLIEKKRGQNLVVRERNTALFKNGIRQEIESSCIFTTMTYRPGDRYNSAMKAYIRGEYLYSVLLFRHLLLLNPNFFQNPFSEWHLALALYRLGLEKESNTVLDSIPMKWGLSRAIDRTRATRTIQYLVKDQQTKAIEMLYTVEDEKVAFLLSSIIDGTLTRQVFLEVLGDEQPLSKYRSNPRATEIYNKLRMNGNVKVSITDFPYIAMLIPSLEEWIYAGFILTTDSHFSREETNEIRNIWLLFSAEFDSVDCDDVNKDWIRYTDKTISNLIGVE